MTLIMRDNITGCWQSRPSAAAASVRWRALRALLLILAPALMAGCLANSGGDATDPVAVENPVVFVERPLLFDDNDGSLVGDNVAEPATFRPGARLLLKDRAAPDSVARDISSRAFSGTGTMNGNGALPYDVKDLSVSADGSQVVFAMRAPEIEGADEEDQPTWNIWQYSVADNSLERLIASDVTAAEGQDIAPAYLPDGRIVFSSTRQRASRAVLLDEGRLQNKSQYAALEEERNVPAFVLHVMDGDGANIEQITFNQSHDLDPLVQDDGTILFSRWDNAGQTRDNGFNLYRVNPDGTGLTYIFGRHSHNPDNLDTDVQFLRPRLSDNGRILAALRPLETANFSAIPTTIDTAGFVETGLAVDGSPGSGQSPLVGGLDAGDAISLNGNYGSVSPLLDGSGRYLISWSPCRLRLIGGDGTILGCNSERVASGDYEAAQPAYGLWLLDTGAQTQRPIEPADEGRQIDEAVLVRERPLPDFIPQAQPMNEAAALADNGYGILEIRSVYDVDGVDTTEAGIAQTANPAMVSPDELPARFLRIEKPVSIPDDTVREVDNTAFGVSGAQSMREIVGYVPIEPDGSVRVAVPANIAFAISVLDDQGQRMDGRHQNWLSLRPGEVVTCNGCHDPASDVPHGRPDAAPESVYAGAPTQGIPFPNTLAVLAMQKPGDTMAQTWAQSPDPDKKTRMPGPDLVYVDEWTDPSLATPGQPFTLSYANLGTPAPVLPECAQEWATACRIIINYEQHIHPIWGRERLVLNEAQEPIDNYTCTGCHSNEDAAGNVQVPEAQLDLSDGPSDLEPAHFKSYRELLSGDNAQEVNGGLLADIQVPTGEVLRDEDTGEPLLDGAGNQIPILEPVPVAASMSTAGARASNRFFSRFRQNGPHEGFLSPAELRLISEWLDIGGQYYNNPFDAPVN